MSKVRSTISFSMMLAVLIVAGILVTGVFPLRGLPQDPREVYRVSDADVPPRLAHKVDPAYTEQARDAKLQGTVMLSLEVWEDGKAHNIRVEQSLGMGLDEGAVDAIRQWRFEPAEKEGEPVRIRANAEVNFRLK